MWVKFHFTDQNTIYEKSWILYLGNKGARVQILFRFFISRRDLLIAKRESLNGLITEIICSTNGKRSYDGFLNQSIKLFYRKEWCIGS